MARNITVAGYATELYYLHIPANYNSARAAPLLVVLHGASGSHTDAITDAHGWVDGSTVFYTEFNNGHTYANQLIGARHSLCEFALSP